MPGYILNLIATCIHQSIWHVTDYALLCFIVHIIFVVRLVMGSNCDIHDCAQQACSLKQRLFLLFNLLLCFSFAKIHRRFTSRSIWDVLVILTCRCKMRWGFCNNATGCQTSHSFCMSKRAQVFIMTSLVDHSAIWVGLILLLLWASEIRQRLQKLLM